MTTTREWVSKSRAQAHLCMTASDFRDLLESGEIPYRENPKSKRIKIRIEDIEDYERRSMIRLEPPPVMVRANAEFL